MLKLSSDIKMVISDFDGVFTDGTFYLDENLKEQKKINFKDVMGIYNLLQNNIKFAFVTGETSDIMDYFTEKFDDKIEIYKGIRKKGEVVLSIIKKHNLKSSHVVYIGDDVNDIPAFNEVKYRVAPNDANPLVKMIDDMQISSFNGGSGAFRELVDNLIGEKYGQ